MVDGPQLLLNGLVAGAGYGLVAVSFAVIYNTTHFFHFAHGATYTLAAYIAYSLIYNHIDTSLAVFITVLVAAVIGAIMEIGVYRPLRFRSASPIVLLIASLGLLITLQNLISLIYGSGTKPLRNAITQEGISILGAKITAIQLVIIFVSFGLYLLINLGLRYTKSGMILRAVANNPSLARIVGVNSQRTILLAFMLGSSLCGAAAVLIAQDSGINPIMGFNVLLFAVVAMIIGGIGNISGSFFGGFIVGFAQQTGAWTISSKWQDAIVFLILIGFLVLRPQGLFGRSLRKVTI